MLLRVFSVVASLGITACTSNNYCLVDQDYQKAEIVPELRPVDGLAIPASPSALRLPERPGTAVPFGTKNAEGDGVCLDKPPEMVRPDRGTSAPEVEVEKPKT